MFIESACVYPMLAIIFSTCNSAAPSFSPTPFNASDGVCAASATLNCPFLTSSDFNDKVILSRLKGIGVLFSKMEIDGSFNSTG